MPNAPRYYRPYPATTVTRQRSRDTRATAPERGYDGAWRKLRNWYASQHPVCEWPRCTQPMGIVDHILPVDERPDLRLVAENLQSLCRSHHAVKTAEDARKR